MRDPFAASWITRWSAALATGVLLRWALGLEPIWWLVWTAPLPLLLAVRQARAGEAFALAALSGLIGPVVPWSYLAGLMPPVVAALIFAAMALLWIATILASRFIEHHGPGWLRPFAFSISLAAFDALLISASPDGSAASLAYTQADWLPIVQSASLGGSTAIVFLLGLPAAVAVQLLAGAAAGAVPWRALAAPVLVFAGALGFGAWRLASPIDGDAIRVAAITIDAKVADRGRDATGFDALLDRYDATIAAAAQQEKPRLILLPERIGDLPASAAQAVQQRLAASAARAEAAVVAGFGVFDAQANHNEAWWTGGEAQLVQRYRKQHLVAGLEAHFTPGAGARVVQQIAGQALALAICKDLDFPATIRRVAQEPVAALVVPAWDFGTDGWLHSRMAMLRGVENGVSMLRSAREGRLTISDAHGRVRAEANSSAQGSTVVGDLPLGRIETFYSRFGGAGGGSWISLFVMGIAASALRRATRATRYTVGDAAC